MAVSGGGKGRSAPACGIEHPQNPAAVFYLRPQVTVGIESLWMGDAESPLHNRLAGPKGGARSGGRHTDIRGFSTRISSPPAHTGFKRLFFDIKTIEMNHPAASGRGIPYWVFPVFSAASGGEYNPNRLIKCPNFGVERP